MALTIPAELYLLGDFGIGYTVRGSFERMIGLMSLEEGERGCDLRTGEVLCGGVGRYLRNG